MRDLSWNSSVELESIWIVHLDTSEEFKLKLRPLIDLLNRVGAFWVHLKSSAELMVENLDPSKTSQRPFEPSKSRSGKFACNLGPSETAWIKLKSFFVRLKSSDYSSDLSGILGVKLESFWQHLKISGYNQELSEASRWIWSHSWYISRALVAPLYSS